VSFSAEHKDELLAHVRGGMRPGAAAELLGYRRDEVFELIDGEEEFRERLELAEREATEHVEEALFQSAVSGNVTAARIWLDRREKPKTTAIVVADDGSKQSGDPELDEMNRLAG
jgi:hypothetical protein